MPHGISVVLSAPAVFRATAAASPSRHAEAAAVLSGFNPPVRVGMRRGEGGGPPAADAGERLADTLLQYMHALGVPDGLGALGYGPDDVPALVAGTLPQKRVTDLAPVQQDAEALGELFKKSLKIY